VLALFERLGPLLEDGLGRLRGLVARAETPLAIVAIATIAAARDSTGGEASR